MRCVAFQFVFLILVAHVIAQAPVQVLMRGPFTEGGGAATIDLSPDQKHLVTAHGTGPAQLWDAQTGKLIRTIQWDKAPSLNAIFLDNETFAVAWTARGYEIGIYKVADGSLLRSFKAGPMPNTWPLLAATPDGKRLVTDAGHIEVWDTATATRLADLGKPWEPRNESPIETRRSVQVTDAGKRLRLSDGHGKTLTYDLDTFEPVGEPRDLPYAGPASFSSDGKRMAVAFHRDLLLYDSNGENQVKTLDESKPGDRLWEYGFFSVSLSPDGTRLAGQKHTRTLVYDLTASPPKRIATLRMDGGNMRRYAWSRDSKRLIAVGTDGRIDDWNLVTGEPTFSLPHEGGLSAIDVSPDGAEALSADVRGRLVRWSLGTGKPMKVRQEDPNDLTRIAVAHAWYLSDGRILTHGEAGRFALLKQDDLSPVREAMGLKGTGGRTAFSLPADGSYIAETVDTDQIKLWDLSTGAERATFKSPMTELRDLACLPDGSLIAGCGSDGAFVIRARDGSLLGEARNGSERNPAVQALLFSRDGRWLIGSHSEGVSAWRVSDFRPDQTLAPAWRAQIPIVWNCGFSSGGGLIMAPSSDKVTVIELQTGLTVATLSLPDMRVRHCVGVPGSSQFLVSALPRFVARYDLRDIVRNDDKRVATLATMTDGELWNRLQDAASADALLAADELARRNQFILRVNDWAAGTKAARLMSQQVETLIATLKGDDNLARERAHRGLEALGPLAAGDVRQALQAASGETRSRLESILRLYDVDDAPPPPDHRILQARIVEVLSWQTDDASRALFAELTGRTITRP